MTLAIACLSPKYLIVVADQRLTVGKGKTKKIMDHQNKVVTVGLGMTFSYAGLGSLEGLKMDKQISRWLQARGEGLRTIPFNEAVEVIRLKATQWFRKILTRVKAEERKDYCHTFMGVGWCPSDTSTSTLGFAVISNASATQNVKPQHTGGVDYRFQWDTDPHDEFTSYFINPLLLPEPLIFPIGSGSREAEKGLRIAYRAARRGCSKETVKKALEEVIRTVAKRVESVGSDVTTVACEGSITGSGVGLVVGEITGNPSIVLGEKEISLSTLFKQ